MPIEKIVVKGAKEHNLKNVDLEIPRNKLVVITGLSGSGKSSLAFDTIYAEGQRRYVESLSAYARQFLEQMEKPDVESIEGLSPAISIEQRTTSRNPRSTVGTATEIYDYLRLLFARIGRPHCFKCGREITSQTTQQIVDQILSLAEGQKIHILAPIVRGRKGEYRKDLDQLEREGYVRVKIDGVVRDLSENIRLDKKKKHDIDVIVDRLILLEKVRPRLSDSVEIASRLSGGIVKVELFNASTPREITYSERFACIDCGVSYPEISPRMFSFNSPHGACPECNGLGTNVYFDQDLIVPDPSLSLNEGALHPWGKRHSSWYRWMITSVADHYGIDLDVPFRDLSEEARKIVFYGSGGEEIRFRYEEEKTRYSTKKSFEGVIGNLNRRYHETDSDAVREEIRKYMNHRPCASCNGARLRCESLFVRINGMSISDITAMVVKKSLDVFNRLDLTDTEQKIATLILKEIRERLGFLVNVGLDYLTLDRTSSTLSGGEGQRIRLATQIGTSLVGVLYILDEPSIGLHLRDNARLIDTLKRLRDLGNTVLVVEHDEATIMAADHVIDMGPGAGEAGGHVVFSGSPKAILKSHDSLTGRYLTGDLTIPIPGRRRKRKAGVLTIMGARENNLKDITVDIPLGMFACVTGVSGSGKSTLVINTLHRALAQKLYRSREPAGAYDEIRGLEKIDKVIDIDQSPIGRTPRSNPATYTGTLTHIRDIFAKLPQSRMRGYGPGRFSFNVKGGRCEACRGDGVIKIEMHFLPDVYVTCDVCGGRRYNRETLEVRYKGRNISDVLDMMVDEALVLFENVPPIRKKLETLNQVGLGYLRLGQPATTLSGGEAQRIKLSKELSRTSTRNTLYILDEPTTGLHFADIHKLLDVLGRLADAGNTIVVIEHNMEVIKVADHIIDLGPEGGDEGGHVVTCGTPEEVAAEPSSYTGKYLKKTLAGTAKTTVKRARKGK
ncbi:excinuclease ABC subunit UvrA [Thermodesulfobacteriota bacterium]